MPVRYRRINTDKQLPVASTALAWRRADKRRFIASGVGTMGTGGGGTILYPQVQGLYPLYSQVKDAAYVKILSKTTLTTRLYKVRTNPPQITKTF